MYKNETGMNKLMGYDYVKAELIDISLIEKKFFDLIDIQLGNENRMIILSSSFFYIFETNFNLVAKYLIKYELKFIKILGFYINRYMIFVTEDN